MGNRHSRQLHLGYPREYQEEYHEYSRRRKVTRALSVRCPLFTSSDASISLVEVRKERPAGTQAIEKDDPEMTKSSTMNSWKVCGHCYHTCPKFIVSTLVNHRDGENVVCKEALSEHTLSSYCCRTYACNCREIIGIWMQDNHLTRPR